MEVPTRIEWLGKEGKGRGRAEEERNIGRKRRTEDRLGRGEEKGKEDRRREQKRREEEEEEEEIDQKSII